MPTPRLPRPRCDAGAEPIKSQPSSCNSSMPSRHVSCKQAAKVRRQRSTPSSSVFFVLVLSPRQFWETIERRLHRAESRRDLVPVSRFAARVVLPAALLAPGTSDPSEWYWRSRRSGCRANRSRSILDRCGQRSSLGGSSGAYGMSRMRPGGLVAELVETGVQVVRRARSISTPERYAGAATIGGNTTVLAGRTSKAGLSPMTAAAQAPPPPWPTI